MEYTMPVVVLARIADTLEVHATSCLGSPAAQAKEPTSWPISSHHDVLVGDALDGLPDGVADPHLDEISHYERAQKLSANTQRKARPAPGAVLPAF